MAINQKHFESAVQEFLNRHAQLFKKISRETVIIAAAARTSYAESGEALFADDKLRHWAQQHITIIPRPGLLKTAASLARKLNMVFPREDSKFWDTLGDRWPLTLSQSRELAHLITENIQDITGIEVLFPVGRMIKPYSEHLQAQIRISAGHEYAQSRDYWDELHKDSDGYRALHVAFKIDRCWTEVQMKTYLSKSWEHYSHDLFYKDALPVIGGLGLQERLAQLSQLLQVCDRMADQLMGDLSGMRKDVSILHPGGSARRRQ